ncbi:MAG: lysyl-tRNA synthetase, class, partial [Thermoleophilaceae bacterium]|nr:lysyl-tRNA synthetase, class [Thermoleophilaceae bacterium]
MSDDVDQPQGEAASLDDRRAKLARLREQGVEPFPHEFPGVVPVADVHAAHGGLEAGEET